MGVTDTEEYTYGYRQGFRHGKMDVLNELFDILEEIWADKK